jgi:hypothetical protein
MYVIKKVKYKAKNSRLTMLSEKSLLGQGHIPGKSGADILRGSPGSPLSPSEE